MIGREEVGAGGWRKSKQHIKHMFFFIYCCLLGDFCVENITKKERSSTEQASNETVAKNSWTYLFANPENVFRTALNSFN